MEKQTLFKTSVFGGFGKQEVLDYIDELSKQSKETEDSLNERISSLVAEQDKLRLDAEEYGSRIAELEGELSQRASEISSQNALIGNLNLEIEKLKRVIAEKKNIIDMQEKQAIEQRRLVEEEKQEVSCQVGEILLKAQHTAEEIISKANQDANDIKSKADAYSQSLRANADSYVEDLTQKISCFKSGFSVLHERADKILSQMANGFDSIDQAVNQGLSLNKQKKDATSQSVANPSEKREPMAREQREAKAPNEIRHERLHERLIQK